MKKNTTICVKCVHCARLCLDKVEKDHEDYYCLAARTSTLDLVTGVTYYSYGRCYDLNDGACKNFKKTNITTGAL